MNHPWINHQQFKDMTYLNLDFSYFHSQTKQIKQVKKGIKNNPRQISNLSFAKGKTHVKKKSSPSPMTIFTSNNSKIYDFLKYNNDYNDYNAYNSSKEEGDLNRKKEDFQKTFSKSLTKKQKKEVKDEEEYDDYYIRKDNNIFKIDVFNDDNEDDNDNDLNIKKIISDSIINNNENEENDKNEYVHLQSNTSKLENENEAKLLFDKVLNQINKSSSKRKNIDLNTSDYSTNQKEEEEKSKLKKQIWKKKESSFRVKHVIISKTDTTKETKETKETVESRSSNKTSSRKEKEKEKESEENIPKTSRSIMTSRGDKSIIEEESNEFTNTSNNNLSKSLSMSNISNSNKRKDKEYKEKEKEEIKNNIKSFKKTEKRLKIENKSNIKTITITSKSNKIIKINSKDNIIDNNNYHTQNNTNINIITKRNLSNTSNIRINTVNGYASSRTNQTINPLKIKKSKTRRIDLKEEETGSIISNSNTVQLNHDNNALDILEQACIYSKNSKNIENHVNNSQIIEENGLFSAIFSYLNPFKCNSTSNS